MSWMQAKFVYWTLICRYESKQYLRYCTVVCYKKTQ